MHGSGVAYVILGALRHEPRSGYEIKQLVDTATRFFWAASYGQIYPELHRLEENGLVESESAPTGARKRRIFKITTAGLDALREWLHGRETRMEMRDESLLRLFFADVLPREEAIALLRGRAYGFGQALEQLQAIAARPGVDPPFVDLALRWGLDYCEWAVDWCRQQEQRLRAAA
jgi:DNA-binding PadR family transcriptional regulator